MLGNELPAKLDAESHNAICATIAPGSAVLRILERLMLPVILIVFLFPFFALLFYSVPAADDFCKATLAYGGVPQPNVLAITWMYYTQWSPRWLTTFTQSLVMSHVDLSAAYGWLLLVVVLTNLTALWYFFRTFFRFTRTNSLLVAGVLYAAWIASITNLDEQVYWLTCATEYMLPLSTVLVLVTLLFQPRRAVWYWITIVLLSLAVPAQHEIAGTFLVCVLVAAIAVRRITRLPGRQLYLSLAAAGLSYAVVMLSPGNAARAAQEHRHLWDIAHFPKWVAHSFYHGMTWLTPPAILVAALCIVALRQEDSEKSAAPSSVPSWFSGAGLGGMFVVLCECALIETGTSTWLPTRLVSWFQLVFWLLFVCVVLTGMPEIYVRFPSATKAGLFVLLAITLFGSANFRAAASDLPGPAESWRRINAARLSKRGGTLVFQNPPRLPRLAKPQMATGDTGCWVNLCLANYLHAKSVIVLNSVDECPH